MRLDLYYLYRKFNLANFGYPIILDVLKRWAEDIGWEVRVFVCKEREVDFTTEADVIGISVYTQTALLAYKVSQKFKKLGKIVLLGGPHFRGPSTFEEAASRCDVVVSSICEDQWKRLLRNISSGKTISSGQKACYLVDSKRNFRYPDYFYESSKNLKWYQYPSVPTAIGCPYDCSFCSPYLKGQYILREINTIRNEVAHLKQKVMFLSDATFGVNKKFTLELMKSLAPLEKKFMVEMSLERLADSEILEALAYGGVKWIITGIESLSLKLKKHGHGNVVNKISKIIDNAHKNDLFIQGSFICGMDCDGIESFNDIYKLWKKSEMDSIMIDILTPYPNTKIFFDLKKQNRIFDKNWAHYDYYHLVYWPLNMTVNQLIDNYIDLYNNVLGNNSILLNSLNIYRNKGIKTASTGLIAYNIYSKLESKKKKSAFEKNKEIILLKYSK